MNLAPNIFKRKAINAREKVVTRFSAYYEAGGQNHGSELARARYNIPAGYGLTNNDISRLEIPFNFALYNNTAPALFWTLSHVYSEPEILADLRSELENLVIRRVDAQNLFTFQINLADLKACCPVLLAVFHEILRFYSVRPNMRQVLEDCVLEDRYLLKKGTIVQLDTRSIHHDYSYWGSDAKTLNLRRFLEGSNGRNMSKNSAAFGTFGAAPFACPGRQFAATEIMTITAQMILRFDVCPTDGQGWRIPKQNQNKFNSVAPPKHDIKVTMTEREGWQGEWKFVLGDKDAKFKLASG